jgi:peptide/nickel transport system ATP-binding protein
VSFSGADVCADIDLAVRPGEIVGLVGESGSGKSVTCRAMTGLLPEPARVRGRMRFCGTDYDLAQGHTLEALRGVGLSMIFQDPMSALDPLMRVRRHLLLRTHADPAELLRRVGIPEPGQVLDSYPHQLSGGQCQRVAIACALARNPRLLIADEPTTALDVTVQAAILHQLKLLADSGVGVLLITHDLAVVNEICDSVLVMRRGRLVEQGPVHEVLSKPRSDYTRGLLGAIPRPGMRGHRLATIGQDGQLKAPCSAAPRPHRIPLGGAPLLEFRNVSVSFPRQGGGAFDAVRNASLSVWRGEIVGIVGESGSGKSSLAKCAVGLNRTSRGRVLLAGTELDWGRLPPQLPRRVQYIFQDPRGALDPMARALAQVRAPLDIHRLGSRSERAAQAARLMEQTGLSPDLHDRKPHGLSGGQRQRVTIARALTLSPEVLICDESVSALDVSVQAQVLNLLMDLRDSTGIAILFISHDLSVIRHICDRVVVMRRGEVVEEGKTETLFAAPDHLYTQTLLAAVPQLPAEAACMRQAAHPNRMEVA